MSPLFASRYRLERRLGVGGMSTVQLGFDTRLERYVAVKQLAEHLAEDQAFVSRFRREALAAARLVHPNIVQVFDFGLDEPTGRHYIVMEYVAGQSCAEILRERGRLLPDEALPILLQACKGLDYAHRNGVVHRDVKPGNLLRSEDGNVKLADFGIAKAAESSNITKTGSVLGTAAYLAPEQARGEPAGSAVDIYALGVVAYQLLSGRLPYEAPSLTELVRMQMRGLPPSLDTFVPEVRTELGQAVAVALLPEPGDRYADAAAFADALDAGAQGHAPREAQRAVTAARTGATKLIVDLDETEATRALPQERSRRRRMEPLRDEHAPPPGMYPPPPTAAPVRGRGQAPQRRRRSGVGRTLLSLLLLLALIGAGAAAVIYIAGSSGGAVQLKEDVRGNVDEAAQELIDLIRDNTR